MHTKYFLFYLSKFTLKKICKMIFQSKAYVNQYVINVKEQQQSISNKRRFSFNLTLFNLNILNKSKHISVPIVNNIPLQLPKYHLLNLIFSVSLISKDMILKIKVN
jgi:hypothetical protein